ncbi:hypothetical protein PV327_005291 [Microctonus hyperodae]|uniref:Centrosomin N-terminal motif 1 domain-containing protein n=1 Tax=Microctonus hyperodae TaxID=165561 RepID=A0AA39G123_MICHY|nr:hypothetical protein PV327_005291 [Microctonus hyperodae]
MPLQDITFNQTSCLINGSSSRSPGKVPSPGGLSTTASLTSGGRTIKDYEDQLGALQKENFQLKLRIYFLEEKMGILGLGTADENAVKKNIELKVEVEALKKELIEKQELLSQAAKAFELHEEQKEVSSRNQAQYEQILANERRHIAELETELAEYKDKVMDPSVFYKETCGITPEVAIEYKEKLHQMEEFVESLEAEIKQLTASLEEERAWGQELEVERDQLRDRLEMEISVKEKLNIDKDLDIESLREKVKTLEGELFKRESLMQQCKGELNQKDRILKEKMSSLEEKSRAYEELNIVAEKRKKQVDQFRASLKSRDDALVDSNNKYRSLLNQFESNYRRSSPPCSPSSQFPHDDTQSLKSNHRSGQVASPSNVSTSLFNWDLTKEKSPKSDNNEIKDLVKELEERNLELKRQDDAKRQLILKLCNAQKSAEKKENELKKLQSEHEKAMKMIQEFIARQHRSEDKQLKKEQKISELQYELKKKSTESTRSEKSGRSSHTSSSVRKIIKTEMIDDADDQINQQRFEQMETKINDLRDEIDIIKEEKINLEMQIQNESEELRNQLRLKEQQIKCLVSERNQMTLELEEKENKMKQLEDNHASFDQIEITRAENEEEIKKLTDELMIKKDEINEQNQKIEQLSKELQIKTQNLQQLVNTELWSKNKEIAKLHNHMTANQSMEKSRIKSEFPQENFVSQLDILIKELNNIGIEVKFIDNTAQLNYIDGKQVINIKNLFDTLQEITSQNIELEKKVDYLKWLKISKFDDVKMEIGNNACELEKAREYCELLRTHVKDLVKFLKKMLESAGYSTNTEQKKMVLDLFASSKILSEDLVQALEGVSLKDFSLEDLCTCKEGQQLIKNQAELIIGELQHQGIRESGQSDSETFSEPDRSVSFARIGLQDVQPKSQCRSRFSKYMKTFSDSEDSINYVPYHKTYQIDLNEIDASHCIQELCETNNLLHSEFKSLRNEIAMKLPLNNTIDDKLSSIIYKLENIKSFCEKLKIVFEKKIHDGYSIKREKLNNARKAQLEKKINDVENMAIEIAKQKSELLQYKENNERKTSEIIMSLNMENDSLRSRIIKLEEENNSARNNISISSKDLDRLTLAHSQVLVENTKLTNDKLRLEQEIRKAENRYELTVHSLQEKFNKQLMDLNRLNETQRGQMRELEAANKELRRHVVVCETSDSAPSSSGVSSVPTDTNLKQQCDDIMQDFHSYNSSQYWLPISYPSSSGRSKSSCSPDLGIESDAAVSTARPLKDTLKITESMTNLLSDEDNRHDGELRDLDRESPLHVEGLDEVETLKKENEALKRRLMKTRRALEDTFEHLSASNKNKKNVEKAIAKQLMITKSILKKTRTYEESFEN